MRPSSTRRPPRTPTRRGAPVGAAVALPTAVPGPLFRSGAVARMAGMPVATLRIWEQRYAAVQPATSPSGHRLYSAADVQRVLLLRALTARGHAIGSIAGLDAAGLQQVSGAVAGVAPSAGRPAPAAAAELRVAVIGTALALRLQRPALALRTGGRLRVVAVFDTPAQAAAVDRGTRADLLLWHAPELAADAASGPAWATRISQLHAARQACGAGRVAVLYRYAAPSALEALATAAVATAREPADDAGLAACLAQWPADAPAPKARRAPLPAASGAAAPSAPARRFDDATLTALAGMGARLGCECPRHVAELLMQLSSFERYSAGCVQRSPADAELHAELQRIAGASRALFESALARVAEHEGLDLR